MNRPLFSRRARQPHADAVVHRITAPGAFERATLGYFDWERKDHECIPAEEQVEVLSLVGDIALHDDKPKIHADVVLGQRDGTAKGVHRSLRCAARRGAAR